MGICDCDCNDETNKEISLRIETIEYVNEKTKKCLCTINDNNRGIGKGFFCKIPFPIEQNLLPVLIINNTIINEKDIKNKYKKIQLTINKDDNKENKEIIMNDLRKTFTNDKYKITMIEIKKEDGIDFDSFLEMDDQI